MAIGWITEAISGIFKPAADLIDNLHTSDEEKLLAKAQLLEKEREVTMQALELENKLVQAQRDIIVTEAKGGWLQRNWRPFLMILCILIIANNFLIVPYINAYFGVGILLDIPNALWNLLSIGVGGYVVGRSGEKIASKWKK